MPRLGERLGARGDRVGTMTDDHETFGFTSDLFDERDRLDRLEHRLVLSDVVADIGGQAITFRWSTPGGHSSDQPRRAGQAAGAPRGSSRRAGNGPVRPEM